MIRSMTGFGVASTEVDGARYVVEIRSLNSKYFKALLRLPEELQGLEGELEPVLARKLTRGSVVLTVRFSDVSADAAAQINARACASTSSSCGGPPGKTWTSTWAPC